MTFHTFSSLYSTCEVKFEAIINTHEKENSKCFPENCRRHTA
jgi:hypothetical protein